MKKNILFISLSLGILIILGIGFSYSLWNISVSQDNINVATTKCFNVEITSQKNSISLENAYPISNEKGKKLTPFSFTITNTCDIFASYTVNLESLKDTTLSSKFINAMINNEEIKRLSDYETTDTVNTGSIESHTLAKGSLGSGDSEGYTLRIWIDYDTTMEDLDNEIKTFKSKIVVKAQPSNWNPVDEGYTTLHDAILANEYQTTPEAAIKKIEAKGTPDFSETAPIIIWQKIHGDSIMKYNSNLPHPNLVGNEQLGGKNLTVDDSKFYLSTTYTFDKETGKYDIKNGMNYAVTEIENLDKSKNYFFCDNYTLLDKTTNQLYTGKPITCKKLKKLINITVKTSGTPNTQNYALNYLADYMEYSQTDLESDKSDKGIYMADDDYGTTYYYRGNILNNNVYFAGFYWQIIRINGDGSIRLIYNGTEKNSKGISQSIGLSNFNPWSNPAYVGYMYGNNIGTRENNIKNENNSLVKSLVDTWYEKNLEQGFSNYIAAAGYCGDRSIYTGNGYSTDNWTNFASEYRLRYNPIKSPTLKCPDKNNDLYTTDDSSIGNKALKYPIGLITADELAMAGMVNSRTNLQGWAYNNYNYYTMTPKLYFSSGGAPYMWIMNGDDYNFGEWKIGSDISIRPVISLKPDVKISGGIGTINEPFIIKTE